jgi:hypothetical protein
VGRLGIVIAAVAAVAAIPAASMAAPSHQLHSAVAAIRAEPAHHANTNTDGPGAYDQCRTEVVDGVWGYCSYNGLDGTDLCVSGVDDLPNWDELGMGCRNEDESFANVSGFPVRLYYSPNFQGAWACVNTGWYSNNLNKDIYTFDNGGSGDAGYGQEIWKNIASSTQASSGKCTNPLPEDG